MEINQCDGCQRGLPINNGCHYILGTTTPLMTCTANRYKESNLGVFEPTRMNTDIHDISKPSQVLYTEEELAQIATNYATACLASVGAQADITTPYFNEWFNQTKKK